MLISYLFKPIIGIINKSILFKYSLIVSFSSEKYSLIIQHIKLLFLLE